MSKRKAINIEYIPSAYIYCCEHGHDMVAVNDMMMPFHFFCVQCGLRDDQIQRLTIGDDIPKAILTNEGG